MVSSAPQPSPIDCVSALSWSAPAFWLWSTDVLFDWVFDELLLPTNVNCGLKFTFLLPTQANASFFAVWFSSPLSCSASFYNQDQSPEGDNAPPLCAVFTFRTQKCANSTRDVVSRLSDSGTRSPDCRASR
jgi:hypothetical protein